MQDAIDEAFEQRIGDVSGRGKLAADMREIWVMQPRFDKRSGNQPFSMVAHIRFRAGFDFFRLRADVGEASEELVEWWQEFSLTDDARREDMMAQVREEQRQAQRAQQRKAQPVVHRLPKADGAESPPPADDAVPAADAPKKRRRRRRKPGGGQGGASDAGQGD